MKCTQLYTALVFAGVMMFGTAGASAQQAAPAATAKHEHGTGSGQHEHGKKAKKDHHDPTIKKQDFGTTTIGGVKFKSITQEGAIVPGEEGAFVVTIADGQKPPKAMRAWVGVATAEGSVKTKLEKEPKGHYHSHVEAPNPLPAGSQYWLEVEPETGPKARAAFSFFTEGEE